MVTPVIQTLQGAIHEGMVLSNTLSLYCEPYAVHHVYYLIHELILLTYKGQEAHWPCMHK